MEGLMSKEPPKRGKPHKKHQVLKPLLVARSISNK
jgi:hypothetical protein